MHNRASGLWKEWNDTVLFAIYEDYTRKTDAKGKAKPVTTGARVMHTSRHPAWDAKSRYMLADTLPLDWETFWSAVRQGSDPQKIRAQIETLVAQVDESTAQAVRTSAARQTKHARVISRFSGGQLVYISCTYAI